MILPKTKLFYFRAWIYPPAYSRMRICSQLASIRCHRRLPTRRSPRRHRSYLLAAIPCRLLGSYRAAFPCSLLGAVTSARASSPPPRRVVVSAHVTSQRRAREAGEPILSPSPTLIPKMPHDPRNPSPYHRKLTVPPPPPHSTNPDEPRCFPNCAELHPEMGVEVWQRSVTISIHL